MKRTVETAWFTFYFEMRQKHIPSENRRFKGGVKDVISWAPQELSVQEGLTKLTEYCDKNNYEIKSIIPLTEGQTQSQAYNGTARELIGNANGAWGLGFGWGVNYLVGFAALLQGIKEFTEEEYKEHIDKKNNLEKNEKINKTIEELKIDIERVYDDIEDSKNTIEHLEKFSKNEIVSKGIVRKSFYISNKKFRSQEEAIKFKEESKIQINSLQKNVYKMESEIEEMQEKINRLQKERS